MHLVALMVVPIVLFCLPLLLRPYYGPYFLGSNSDPDYAYLLNSLNIIHFIVPGHTDHPGTTLQLLGAVGLLLKWFGHVAAAGQLGIDELVLKTPEQSLAVISLFINWLVFVAFAYASVTIYRSLHSILPVLVFQLSLLVPLQVKVSLLQIRPEPLLVFSVLLVTALVVRYRHGSRDLAQRSGLALPIGIAMGFGLATKITFLPLLLLILLLATRRERFNAFAACVMSFLLFTLPITTKFPQMLSWFGSILAHSGQYGAGEVGIAPFAKLLQNLASLIQQEPTLFIALAFYLSFLLVRKYRAGEVVMDPGNRLLLVGSGVIIVQILMTVKHPGVHYLLPAVAITALLNAEMVARLERGAYLPAKTSGRWLIGLIAMAGVGYASLSLRSWALGSEMYFQREAALWQKLRAMDRCSCVAYYRASTLEYALAFGNDFAGWRYGKELARIYPGKIFYNLWSHQFYSYEERVNSATMAELLRGAGRILMVGAPLEPQSKPDNLKLTALIVTPHTAAYEVEK